MADKDIKMIPEDGHYISTEAYVFCTKKKIKSALEQVAKMEKAKFIFGGYEWKDKQDESWQES